MCYSENNTTAIKSEICQCDEDCTMYGDCCFDRAKLNIKNKASTFHNKWECRHFTPNVSNILVVYKIDINIYALKLNNKLYNIQPLNLSGICLYDE